MSNNNNNPNSNKLILIPNLDYAKSSKNLKAVNQFNESNIINIQPKKLQSNENKFYIHTQEFKTNRNFMETTDRDDIPKRVSSKRLSIAELKSNNRLHPMLSFLNKTIAEETQLENEEFTKFYFSKIKYDEIVSAIFTINAVLGSIIYYEVKQMINSHGFDDNNIIIISSNHSLALKCTLIFITINTILYSK